jgi:hypothetical protein
MRLEIRKTLKVLILTYQICLIQDLGKRAVSSTANQEVTVKNWLKH